MIRDIILLQKREIEDRMSEDYVERELALKKPSRDLVTVILGPRRAGKSFFAMHLIGRTGRFGYVNFDDERLSELDNYDELTAALNVVYQNPKYLLLDEVQNLPKWELFVNRLQRQGFCLTITGSNAHLLSSELATHLTGRHIPVVLFPFSFPEYIRALGRDLTNPELAEELRRFAEIGGYPEPLLKDLSRREYLTTLLRSILYKDIVVRHRIRSPQGLEDLASYLMANIAHEYSLNGLAKVTHFRSVHTVEKYLRHLEEAFLFFSVRRFSFKVREQVRSNRKIYCTDNGMITASSFRFSSNLGNLYENLVAISLKKQELDGRLSFYFWKNEKQEEVDFVVKKGIRVTSLLQVCLNLDDPKTKQREIRALLKASSELRCKKLYIISDVTEGVEEVSWYGLSGRIRFVPLRKWLLETDLF
ncbi:ATP-binding protein [Acidobacteriota bacterium]